MTFSADPLLVLDLLLRGAVVGGLALTAALVWRAHPRSRVAQIGAWFAAGLAAYVLRSIPGAVPSPPPLWQAPILALAAGNAVVFWLFCRSLFDDDARLRGAHLGAYGAVIALSMLHCYGLVTSRSPQAEVLTVALRWLPLLFAGLALAEAISDWRADLVERRRRLRAFIVFGGAAYTLGSLLAGRYAAGGPSGAAAAVTLVDTAALALLVGAAAWILLAAPRDEVLEVAELRRHEVPDRRAAAPGVGSVVAAGAPPPAAVAVWADPAETALADRLQRAMAQDHFFREEGLTIGALARRLGVAEYRLRRLINQRLGHRNFNVYLNRWRLDEATRALSDPARAAVPVLSIALDAGFQSIGPFNRAFKADTGLTPTEFRRRTLGESSICLADSGIGASAA